MSESVVIAKLSGCREECVELKDITMSRLSITVTLSQMCNCTCVVARAVKLHGVSRYVTGDVIRNHMWELTRCQWMTVPVFHYLLPDHLDVLKALHTADVVHQDVGVGVANTSAAQIQPLLQDRHAERKTKIYKQIEVLAMAVALDWNISTTDDPLTFNLPPVSKTFSLFCEISQHLLDWFYEDTHDKPFFPERLHEVDICGFEPHVLTTFG